MVEFGNLIWFETSCLKDVTNHVTNILFHLKELKKSSLANHLGKFSEEHLLWNAEDTLAP